MVNKIDTLKNVTPSSVDSQPLLILASKSSYKQALMKRLCHEFTSKEPTVDEENLKLEFYDSLKLGSLKIRSENSLESIQNLNRSYPSEVSKSAKSSEVSDLDNTFENNEDKMKNNAFIKLALFLSEKKARSLAQANNCVIGSDQIAFLENTSLSKPGSFEKAFEQLSLLSGKTHHLVTAVSLIYKDFDVRNFFTISQLKMKILSEKQISKYLQIDQPFDCAGSYKIECQGISLFEEIETKDFTSIEGLPLLSLSKELEDLGYKIPST